MDRVFIHIITLLPSILLILELCMSGQAFSIFLLSSLAQTMNAFIGRFTCPSRVSSESLLLPERMILAPNILPGVTAKSTWVVQQRNAFLLTGHIMVG